ncbi:MAG: Hsp70 family protein [Bacteroidota bacterium]|nr:Hsp70 family protein [Bacteroidota bacterium]
MASDRINYGIDLGTTNSTIAGMQRGKPVVIKSTVGEFQMDTTPSAVAFMKRRSGISILCGVPGRREYNRDCIRALKMDSGSRNAFVEFKRTMGTDHRYAPDIAPEEDFASEELSAEVLKKLRSYVTEAEIRAAVVTMPAAFTVPQQQATLRAANLAGLRQCVLLQEPVAAAMAFGLTHDRGKGKWLVFDFGGGTFDAALVLVEDGEITIKDTEGDNHLGGKDLDFAVVDEIILTEIARDLDVDSFHAADPGRINRLRDVLKRWAEKANIALSTADSHEVYTELDDPIKLPNGPEIELDFEITRERLRPVVTPIFQRAIDKAGILLQRHGLTGSDLDELILVGGPTYSPILREMLAEQIRKPNTSVDPMTVVAQGAALFASTVSLDPDARPESQELEILRLDVGYESTTLSEFEFVSVKFGDGSDHRRWGALEVELVATNSAMGWRTGKHLLTDGNPALLEPRLEENKPNVFDLIVTTERGDRVSTIPSEITIIHGTKVTGSPLTNNLGVEVWDEAAGERVFAPLRGAEKSKRLPVTGIGKGLSTPAQITPGVPEDRLLIRIYEGGADAPGVPVCLCDHVMALELTGEQVNRVIPAGTALELKIVTQQSSAVPEEVTVRFPVLEVEEFILHVPELDRELQTEWISNEVIEARKRMDSLQALGLVDSPKLDEIGNRIEAEERKIDSPDSDADAKTKAISRLKEALRELFNLSKDSRWPVAETELDEIWLDLQRANREEGRSDTRQEMQEARIRVNQVKEKRDPRLARELTASLKNSIFELKRCEIARSIIAWARTQFYSIRWKNDYQARQVVNRGVRALVADEPCSSLLPCAGEIVSLLVQDSSDGSRPPIPHLDQFTQ